MNKALFLSHELPFPPRGGGKLRDAHILKLLMEQMEVEVLCFKGTEDPESIPEGLKVTVIDRQRAPIWKRAFYPVRPYVVNGYCDVMAQAIVDRAEEGKILWISRLAMAQYVPLARSLGYKIILDEHNVESNLLIGNALSSVRAFSGIFVAAQCSYYESRFCLQSDMVVATSHIDASRLSKLAPGAPIHVIPNSVDCVAYESVRSTEGDSLFFSGTLSYQPNVAGLHWFVDEILPRLRGALGGALPRIVVAGADPSAALRSRLEGAQIKVVANPPSILPHLAEASVVFVPILSGGGTRLKILEAMAAGRAVVSTGKGAEGLVLSPTYDILIADQPDHFASSILKLLNDKILRQEIQDHASASVESRYDWRRGRPLLDSLLSDLKRAPVRARK